MNIYFYICSILDIKKIVGWFAAEFLISDPKLQNLEIFMKNVIIVLICIRGTHKSHTYEITLLLWSTQNIDNQIKIKSLILGKIVFINIDTLHGMIENIIYGITLLMKLIPFKY